jgi:hypothetical protein
MPYKIMHLGTCSDYVGICQIDQDIFNQVMKYGRQVSKAYLAVFTTDLIQESLTPWYPINIKNGNFNIYHSKRIYRTFNEADTDLTMLLTYDKLIVKETGKQLTPINRVEFQIVSL